MRCKLIIIVICIFVTMSGCKKSHQDTVLIDKEKPVSEIINIDEDVLAEISKEDESNSDTADNEQVEIVEDEIRNRALNGEVVAVGKEFSVDIDGDLSTTYKHILV